MDKAQLLIQMMGAPGGTPAEPVAQDFGGPKDRAVDLNDPEMIDWGRLAQRLQLSPDEVQQL